MKYWVFQNNQVNGPYEPGDLSRLPGFSAETLVCPEGRKGTSMGDWQRVSMVPELSSSLLTGASGGSASSTAVALAPEPTLKDLAALGTLQEKVGALDATLGKLQESLRAKDGELQDLRKALEDKERQAQELASKIGGLEQRLPSADFDSKMREQAETIAELTRQVDTLKTELKDRAALAPGPVFGSAEPQPAFGAAEPAPASPLEIVSPSAPAPAADPFSASLEASAPSTAVFSAPTEPAPVFAPTEPISAGSGSPDVSTASFAPLFDAPTASVSADSLVETQEPKKGSKAPVFLLLLAALAAGGAAAWKLGMIPTARQAPKPAATAGDRAPLPPPPATAVRPEPPRDPEEELKAEAIATAKAWSTAGGKTVGMALEPAPAPAGALSPWLADKIRDDVYQVNFYAKTGDKTSAYEFEVHLGDKQVYPHNELAQALLTGKTPPATRRKKPARRKPTPKAKTPTPKAKSTRRRPSGTAPSNILEGRRTTAAPAGGETPASNGAGLDSLLQPDSSEPPAGAAHPADNVEPAPKPAADSEELLPGVPKRPRGADAAEGAQAPAQDGTAPTPKKKGSDADLLDDLLKP